MLLAPHKTKAARESTLPLLTHSRHFEVTVTVNLRQLYDVAEVQQRQQKTGFWRDIVQSGRDDATVDGRRPITTLYVAHNHWQSHLPKASTKETVKDLLFTRLLQAKKASPMHKFIC